MAKIKIEKNIPMPAKRSILLTKRSKPRCKYPFDQMKVGDSFALPRGRATKYDRVRTSVIQAAATWTKATGISMKFATRLVDNDTLRVWRTA